MMNTLSLLALSLIAAAALSIQTGFLPIDALSLPALPQLQVAPVAETKAVPKAPVPAAPKAEAKAAATTPKAPVPAAPKTEAKAAATTTP